MADWQPIETAPKQAGKEILGSRWVYDKEVGWQMTKEPFVSFWSPTLNKWYVDPTHFVDMPEPPEAS